MSSLDDRPFPTGALIGAGLLILTTVAGVGAIQISKHFAPAAQAYGGSPVKVRALRFVDAGDGVSVFGGHVRVFDAATGAELPQLRDNDGFVRAVLNSLSFERTKRGIAAPPTFQLVQWSDNRVTLGDPATGAKVSIGEFGAKNKAVFMRFLRPAGATS